MINTNNALLSMTLVASLSFSTLTNAQLLSEEIFKNVAGQRFWQVQVDCDSSNPSQQLNKDVASEQWCINDTTNCYSDKQQAAEKACNGDTSNNISQVTTPEATPPALNPSITLEEDDDDDYDGDEQIVDYNALRKEKSELEATHLKIKQQILELKRQEIELKKSISVN